MKIEITNKESDMSENWNEIARKIQFIMDEEVAMGRECGCQMVIYEKGKKVLDLVSGYTTFEQKEKINPRHLFPIFSCGKPILAAAALQGMDKGYFTKDTPVADIWKGFEVNGKGDITMEHVLSHRAGLQALPPMESEYDLADWEKMCAGIASAVPASPAGKLLVYHGTTFAFTVGRPVELAAGKSLYEIMKYDIMEKCGNEKDFYFGVDEEADKRFVPVVDDKNFTVKPSGLTKHMNDPIFRKACIPSFNGCATANGLARFYAALAGDIPGCELVKPETLKLATCRRYRDPEDPGDPDCWTRFGLGMVTWFHDDPGAMFGQGGACGSEGYYLRDRKWGVAFVKNHNIKNHPNHIVRDRIAEVLGLPIRHW